MKNWKSRFLLISILHTLASGCGVREDEKAFENVLAGTWNMDEIKCYYPDYSGGDRIERYILSKFEKIEMVMGARSFSYAVTETAQKSTTATCITSASGRYIISFTNASKGLVNYKEIVTSSGCSIPLSDTGGGGTISVPFGFSASSDNTVNMPWEIIGDGSLVLAISTDFYGSSVGSLCSDSCYCYGFYTKETAN